ncbi:IclR family transcriptional regulator [Ruegeria sp. Ofav3-42]|uniref:IclR family transcriptional regulator n=1 Tax=Ruegeria sp. Ofav3-42 TaxID=2917759 RepID=UPI001EF56414|nr:IclR family transcriptional regulator [Ruegeria sp. Ofav3-42]MCG7519848.1 IclR family transcriptional regulator [Ruegeria sp. Ofav3-42]
MTNRKFGRTQDKTSESGPSRKGTIQSVSIAARFLSILANSEGPLALGEIARRAETGSSTAHRYLSSLQQEGLATQEAGTGHYDLGPAALGIGLAALQRLDPIEVAARQMKELAGRVAASAGVVVWTERGPTVVRWYRGAYFSISSLSLGDVLPIDNSACGLAFQAFLPPAMVKVARRNQPSRTRGKPPRREVLQDIRSSGLAELSSHLITEVTGQAVPVFDAQNEIVCAMTIVADLGSTIGPSADGALAEAGYAVAKATGTTRWAEFSQRPDIA